MSFRRHFETAVRLGALAAALAALSACEEGSSVSHRSLGPIPAETLALMEQAGATKEAPTLIRAYKKEAEFEVWKMRSDGRYAHVKTYPICRWSGQLGPKVREGDRQAPEGFYAINPGQMNPNSAYYLSFNVGYPNAYDRAWGHSGGTIMVHGACSSAGCFSMTDRQIAEIYAIARTSLNAGQRSIQMQSYPFRMTAENLARHRLDPNIGFWKQLKQGADHFEVTKKEPRVSVCGGRYVFDANGACPSLRYEADVQEQVAQKAARDDAKIAELAAQGVKPVKLVYRDGGQHPAFQARVAEVSRPETLTPPTEIALDDRPSRAASKSAARLAAKSPVVTLASAKAVAQDKDKDEAPRSVVSVAGAKPSGIGAAPTRVSNLDADQGGSANGSGRGWIGLHKDQKDKDHAAEQKPVAETAAAPQPPARTLSRRAGAGAKKPTDGPLEQALRDTMGSIRR